MQAALWMPTSCSGACKASSPLAWLGNRKHLPALAQLPCLLADARLRLPHPSCTAGTVATPW